MTASEIIQLVSLSASLLASLIGFIIALVKAIKNKKWDLLKDTLQDFISKAEGFTNFTGAEKKAIVLSWASNFCGKQGIKFNENKVGTVIDELVELTKKVNQRDKDKIVVTEENKEEQV